MPYGPATCYAAARGTPAKYNCDPLSDDDLAEVCSAGLEPGELWRPFVKVDEEGGHFFWRDAEDNAPTKHGPFATRREALLDALEVEGVEHPEEWGIAVVNRS